MQNAKDTFYEVLKTRLAALNPERTIVLRGVTRPGVLVEENEIVSASVLPDCFRLRWLQVTADANGARTTVTLQCEIVYETAGSADNAGMDRGRLLGALDAELQTVLNTAPRNAPLMDYAALANAGAAVADGTSLWWAAPVFGNTVVKNNRLSRSATVEVMAYE